MRADPASFDPAELIRLRRRAIGLDVGSLAKRSGVGVKDIQNIESGNLALDSSTMKCLLAAMKEKPSTVLARNRIHLLETAEKYGVSDIRVFGSVARNQDTENSDLDFLVNAPAGKGIRRF